MEDQAGTLPRFPFGLTAVGLANENVINAADSHVLELQSILSSKRIDYSVASSSQASDREQDQGDVLAIVTFDHDMHKYHTCSGQPWPSTQIRMSSEKLKALSSAKINEMFEPRRQQRVCRRLGFTKLPPGVEYVLDFTPPSEGAELADLTAALWLPRMVKLWFLAGLYLPEHILESPAMAPRRPMGENAVGAILTLGHDDACKYDACLDDLKPWQTDLRVPGIYEEDPYDANPKYIPDWRKIDDYCRVRHRVAIMRVLRAINGHGLLLNSAARMWTVAQVAIHLEVPQVVVDPVTQWLIAPPNTKFLEICPERAFQLAYALQIPSVLIASFRILVSEHAVDYLATPASPKRPMTTWAKRQRDDYGDFPSDPVEYASRAFADRISGVLSTLLSGQAFDSFPVTMSQWELLKNIGAEIETWPTDLSGSPHPLETAYEKLVMALLTAFYDNIYTCLEEPFRGFDLDHIGRLMEAQRKHYIPDRERAPLHELYRKLNIKQKALTSLFWLRLRNTDDFGSFSERVYDGRQLWRLAKDFNSAFNSALSAGAFDVESLMAKTGKAMYEVVADFDLAQFIEQLCFAVRSLCDRVLDRGAHEKNIAFFLSDHLLLSLNEHELNYLPIWADGLDDGSGGVFQEPIPLAEMGPNGPGPAYHTGYTVGTDTTTDYNSTIASSDLGIGDLDIYSNAGDTVRSLDAQQSVTTAPNRHQIVPLSDGGFDSETFSAVEDDYADARFLQPAEHQAVGQAVAAYVEEDNVAWSDAGSVVGVGLVPTGDRMDMDKQIDKAALSSGPHLAETGSSSTNRSTGGGGAAKLRSSIDEFGLDNDEDMVDTDYDTTSTVDTTTIDGSEYDLV